MVGGFWGREGHSRGSGHQPIGRPGRRERRCESGMSNARAIAAERGSKDDDDGEREVGCGCGCE